MRLHQIKIDFRPEEDRLLLLASTSDGAELRLWLTRRFVKLLWPLLVKLAVDVSPRIREQANPEARKALLGMQHQEAVSKANFSKPYEAAPRATPLGDAPILLTRIQTGRDRQGHAVLALHPAEGQGVTFALDDVLLHALFRLIRAAAAKADWGLDLALPGGEPQPAEGPARTVN